MKESTKALAESRIQGAKADIVAQLSQDLVALDEGLNFFGTVNSGARVSGATDIVVSFIGSVGDSAWQALTDVLSADPPPYSEELASEMVDIVAAALPEGTGIRALGRHLANMRGAPLDAAERQVTAARERVLRQVRSDAELYALKRRADRKVPWYAKPGMSPALVTAAAVLIAGVLPYIADVPWRLTWGRPEDPHALRSETVVVAVPDSVRQQLLALPGAIEFEELVAALRDSSATDLNKSEFRGKHQAAAVAWAGVLKSARMVDLALVDPYLEAELHPVALSGLMSSELISVRFDDGERERLGAVPEGAGVAFRGKLRFRESAWLPYVAEAKLLGYWTQEPPPAGVDSVSAPPN